MHQFYAPWENVAKGMNDPSKMVGQEAARDQGSCNGDS